MNADEMMNCLNHVQEMFPRFNASPVAAKWWLTLTGRFSKQQFMAAFKRFLLESEHPPSIAKMNAILKSMFAREKRQVTIWDRDYQIIDFCMDMLSPKFVGEAIAEITGPQKSEKAFTTLTQKKDWVKGYRAAKRQLWDLAVAKWKESGPPAFRFWRGEEQRPWDLIGAPHFIRGDMNITPVRNTALGRVPYEIVDGYTPPELPLTEIKL